jgi:hypothetical protein
VETEAAALMRRLDGIPQLPLENERSKVLSNASYAVVMALPAAQRARETELAVEEMQAQRRADNIAIAALNADRRLVYENRVARDLAKVTDRPKMTAWLLGAECLSPEALNEVKADGLYTATGLSANVALEIIRRVLGGVSAANRKLKSLYLTDLRAVRQDNIPTHVYGNKFKLAYRKCQSIGTVITEADLIDMYIFNLNLSVFEFFIRDYNNDPTGVGAPTTLAAAMNAAKEYQDSIIAVNPAIGKILDNSAKAFVAYSVEEGGHDDSVTTTAAESISPLPSTVASVSSGTVGSSGSTVRVPCQICGKTNHLASHCFKIADPEFVKQISEEMSKNTGYSRRRQKGGRGGGGATGSIASVSNGSAPPSSVSSVAMGNEPYALEPTDRIDCMIASVSDVSSVRVADFEHDDHAEVSVINEDTLWLLDSVTPCDDTVVGVVPGVVLKVTQRGVLKYDMGKAVVIPGAPKLLASAREIRKAYNWSCDDGMTVKYVHKKTHAVLKFRLDPLRFKDDFFHAVLSDEAIAVSSVDFYNPAPLAPVMPRDEGRVWPMIRAVERLHWATNHMSVDDMARLCESPSYIGDVSRAAIDLFVAHRGCSACRMGIMPEHSQLSSTRGLSTIVGDTVQGDIFFIEGDGAKVPVMLVACEASTLVYMHAFEEAAARARGPRVMVNSSELEAALMGVFSMWENAGHRLRSFRFDRESAVTSGPIRAWLDAKGVSLDLTAAGQKLGLAEVLGRIVKNRCRSSVSGILEKFGYRYKAKWFVELAGDTVKVMNRTVRRGSSLSPYQKFFGGVAGLDVRRDLRASIGEVLLFKSPKRGVSTDISEMKAEWGVVTSRTFNGSGVIKVYLVETKSYGHRFKFERVAVPAYVMQLLREMVPVSGPVVYEPAEPDAPTEAVSEPPCPDSTESNVADDIIAGRTAWFPSGINRDVFAIDTVMTILSSQISYKKRC